MSLLELIKENNVKGSLDSNFLIQDLALESGVQLEVGDNYSYCFDSSDIKETALIKTSELLEFLKSNNVSYPDTLEDDFLNINEYDNLTVYLNDSSGEYAVELFLGTLDINGNTTLAYWIDFSNMTELKEAI